MHTFNRRKKKFATIIIIIIIIPRSRVLLDKLTGSQLVKKFPAFYGTRRFKRAHHLTLSSAIIIIIIIIIKKKNILSHTSQHLPARRPSPIPERRWSWDQSGEGNHSATDLYCTCHVHVSRDAFQLNKQYK